MNQFQQQCVEFLRQFIAARVLDADGKSIQQAVRDRLKQKAAWFERGLTLGLALASDPAWQTSPYPAAAVVNEFALHSADVWARELIAHCASTGFPPSFEMICIQPLLSLLLPRVSRSRQKPWLAAARAVGKSAEKFLTDRRDVLGKPGPYTGCGPNHLFIIASSLYRIGMLLGSASWQRLGRDSMHRLCRLQADEGYFPEDTGPAIGYHRVSTFGVCNYLAASGDETARPVAERAIGFATRAMYPDLLPIETLDQRNRTYIRTGQAGKAASVWDLTFGWTPAGRRSAAVVLARLAERLAQTPAVPPFSDVPMVALAAMLNPDGPVAKILPCERAAFVERFDDKAVIVRRDGWAVVLSGYHQSNRPGNPFILDRTANVSVFHDRFGLVIGGGNDKRRFDAATFELAESGYVWYFPPICGTARGSNGRGQVDLNYGAAQARMQAVIRSPRVVELIAGAKTNFGNQVDWLNLQIPVGPGSTVRIDGKAVKLTEKMTETKAWPVRKAIETAAGLRIEPLGGGEFRWPHRPWDSYNIPEHTSAMSAAVGYLRLSLSGKDLAERKVRITAG